MLLDSWHGFQVPYRPLDSRTRHQPKCHMTSRSFKFNGNSVRSQAPRSSVIKQSPWRLGFDSRPQPQTSPIIFSTISRREQSRKDCSLAVNRTANSWQADILTTLLLMEPEYQPECSEDLYFIIVLWRCVLFFYEKHFFG